jgi:hypothetical protein
MDPYIEACGLWEDFHSHFIESMYRALAPRLPRGYRMETPTRGYVVLMESEGKKDHTVKPDLAITEPTATRRPRKKGGTATAEPADANPGKRMRAFVAEEFEEKFIEIYQSWEDRVLVTCIEVLSPSNKRRGTRGWTEYERKRQAMLLGEANFVEIDLLRGGDKMAMLDPWPDSPYTLLLCRQAEAPYCRVWEAHFKQRLPELPIPLIPPAPDLRLDLQPLLEEVYTLGRYEEAIDYSRALTPRLSKAEAAWVREQLQSR